MSPNLSMIKYFNTKKNSFLFNSITPSNFSNTMELLLCTILLNKTIKGPDQALFYFYFKTQNCLDLLINFKDIIKRQASQIFLVLFFFSFLSKTSSVDKKYLNTHV